MKSKSRISNHHQERKPRGRRPDAEIYEWTYQTDDTPFWLNAGPVQVELVDGNTETWEHPDRKRNEAHEVRRWRPVPPGLWAER